MSDQLEVSKIRLDGGTQPRAELDQLTIDDYADNMANGDTFPPVVVFYDGADHWLADGFHRLEAHKQLGLVHVDADVRQGTRRDAVLFSVSANSQHGKRRTNADKRRAVITLLSDPEWGQWSDREIARQCKVSNRFVSTLRLSVNGSQIERKARRNGSTYTVDTSNIGRLTLTTEVREAVKDTPLADNPQAIKELAKLPEDAQKKIAEVAVKNYVEHAETIPFMYHHMKRNSDTWEEIEKSGVVQPGDEDEAVYISDHPLKLASVTRFKSDIHRGLALDETNGRQKPKINRKGDEYEPQGHDLCQTPPEALDPLLPYLQQDWTIWEPAKGEGLLVEALYDSGFQAVVSGDIQTGSNFFDYEPPAWDCLITNPPYSIKYQWLERCYTLGKPFALLLPVETLGAKTAQAFFRQYGVEMVFIDGRVNFKMPNIGWEGSSAQFPVAWFTFGLDLPQQMIFSGGE